MGGGKEKVSEYGDEDGVGGGGDNDYDKLMIILNL